VRPRVNVAIFVIFVLSNARHDPCNASPILASSTGPHAHLSPWPTASSDFM